MKNKEKGVLTWFCFYLQLWNDQNQFEKKPKSRFHSSFGHASPAHQQCASSCSWPPDEWYQWSLKLEGTINNNHIFQRGKLRPHEVDLPEMWGICWQIYSRNPSVSTMTTNSQTRCFKTGRVSSWFEKGRSEIQFANIHIIGGHDIHLKPKHIGKFPNLVRWCLTLHDKCF